MISLNKIKIWSLGLCLFLVGFLITTAFVDLPKTFFQQDEWQFFGSYISALASSNPLLNIILPFGGQLTHFYPLSTLLFLLEFMLFGMNFSFYAYASLLLHFANAFLVYYLVRRITERAFVALATAAIFSVSSFSHQAITWVLAGTFTLPAALFLLISLVGLVKYLEDGSRKSFLLSLCALVVSLLFKEIAVFMFIFIPLWLFLGRRKRLNAEVSKNDIRPLLGIAGFYIVLRLFFLFFNVRSPQPEVGDVSAAPFGSYVYRTVTVPLKGVAQSFFPQEFIISLSDGLVHLAYPQLVGLDGIANPQITQTVVFDLVSYVLALVVFIFSFLIFRHLSKRRDHKLSQAFLLALLLVVTSFLPFIFIPGKAGYFSIFEPRNLYIGSIGASLMVAILLYLLVDTFIRKQRLASLLMLAVLLFILMPHVKSIRRDLLELKRVGQVRESLLVNLEKNYPSLPSQVVIYTVSNKPYYGMPEEEKILPIQSGFGRMVMVWYQNKEKFPACLYENQFLHDLLSQGYRYCDGRGLGYFRDYDKLVSQVGLQNIGLEDIIAYEWDGNTEQFTDITQQVRRRIKKELGQ